MSGLSSLRTRPVRGASANVELISTDQRSYAKPHIKSDVNFATSRNIQLPTLSSTSVDEVQTIPITVLLTLVLMLAIPP